MEENDDSAYLIPCSIAAFSALLGALIAGTSYSTVSVPTVVTDTNRPTIAKVPSPTRNLGGVTGGLLMAGGIVWFGKSLRDGLYKEKEFVSMDGVQALRNGALTGQPTFIQDDVVSGQPTILDSPSVPKQTPKPAPTTKVQVVEPPTVSTPVVTTPTPVVKPPLPSKKQPKYLDLLLENTIIIVGNEKGSGKTSRLGWLLAEFIKMGAHVKFCSSIIPYGTFLGLETARGKEGDYSQINKVVKWFVDEMNNRSELVATVPNYNPFEQPKLVLALDEGSNYSQYVNQTLMGKLWDASTQLTRQMNGCILFCSHGTTLTMLGGREALDGKRDTINNGACWLKLSAVNDPNVPGNKRPCQIVEVGKIKNSSDWQCEDRFMMPLGETAPPENYDYRTLVNRYCPQFIYPPTQTQPQEIN